MNLFRKIFVFSSFVSFGLMLPNFSFAVSAVDLGAAGNFAVLSKAGITTSGATAISGDVGVSPASASSLSGFAQTVDASNQFSTSVSVGGKIYAADYSTSTALTKAIGDMQTAYNDAASRSFPTATGKAGGEIGGLTFMPGTYKWNSGATIASDITLSGGSEDAWIFQVGENLTVSSGVKIILTDGALAKNIFWQVAGQTVLGSQSVFSGNILGQSGITLQNGALVNGRIFGGAVIILNANAITAPGVTPFVPSLVPVVAPPVLSTATTNATSTISAPVQNPSPVVSSNEDLQKQVDTLLKTLQGLVAQAKSAGITISSQPNLSVKPTIRFTRDLSLGLRGSDVSALQTFLIAKKAGQNGDRLFEVGATGYFGSLTQKALAEFQKSVGIAPAGGYLGTKTMSYLNSI